MIVKKYNRTCRSMTEEEGAVDYSHLTPCLNNVKKWDLSCQMKDGSCFYFVTCEKRPNPSLDWSCKEVHDSSAIPACCDFICPKNQ